MAANPGIAAGRAIETVKPDWKLNYLLMLKIKTMLNRNSSAGTAAQRSSKRSLLFRPALLVAIPMLCAVFCDAQTLGYGLTGIINTDTTTSIDTVKVVLLVGDTSHRYSEYMQFQSCEDVGCKDTTQKHFNFVSHYKNVKEDKGNYGSGQTYWAYGYSVRRKECCVNGYSGNFAIYQPVPYYTHLEYLDDKNKPLKSTLIIWQSVPAK